LFAECWKLYGRKEEKEEGYSQWRAATKLVGTERELRDLVVAALSWQAPAWAADNWKFAVYFHRYLKRKKYRDERPSLQSIPRAADDRLAKSTDKKLAEFRAAAEHAATADEIAALRASRG